MNTLEKFENMTIKELRELTEQFHKLMRNPKLIPKKPLRMPENLNMEYYIDEINAKENLK